MALDLKFKYIYIYIIYQEDTKYHCLSVAGFHFSLSISPSARWSWFGGMSPSRNWPPVTQMEESLFGSNMKVAGPWSWSMTVVHR